MSFLRKVTKQQLCECNAQADTGAMSLQVVPKPSQIDENQTAYALKMQKQVAQDLQNSYFPGMDLITCNTHMKTCNSKQCNESLPEHNVPLHDALKLLDDANLTIRVNHMNHGVDSQAACGEVTNEHLTEMLTTGATDIQTPNGMFQLCSNNNSTISSIKYFTD